MYSFDRTSAGRDAHLPGEHRYRRVGQQPAGWLGLGYYELRFLDRYRPRGHADFGHSVSVPAEVADIDQPFRRGHDAVRRDVRRYLPVVSYRPSVARVLLAVPDSQHRPESVAELPQPADLGRVRGIDVLHRFSAVLVHWLGSGSGDAARSRYDESPPGCLRTSELGLARIGTPLAPLRTGLPDPCGYFDAPGAQRPLSR